MQYRHATLLLFIVIIGTGILTVAVFERRSAIEEARELEKVLMEVEVESFVSEPLMLFGNEYLEKDIDLNGDGITEHIVLHLTQSEFEGTYARLQVGESVVDVPGNNSQGYFGVVDVNAADGKQEIAISDLGSSSDFTTAFYSYNGEILALVGVAEGLYERMTFDGAGKFTTITRAAILDTWFFEDEYIINGDGVLERIERGFYTRLDGGEVILTASKDFQISPSNTGVAFTSVAGDEIKILGCDNVAWCKIQNVDGLEGWFSTESTSLDVFSGLFFAD